MRARLTSNGGSVCKVEGVFWGGGGQGSRPLGSQMKAVGNVHMQIASLHAPECFPLLAPPRRNFSKVWARGVGVGVF